MKAEVAQQRSLLELSKLDAELSRLTHRAAHLPEQETCRRMQEEYDAAGDRQGAVRIALEDIDAHVKRLESEIDAVRQREDRDRALLQSGATTPNNWRTCSTSWRPCNVARPAWRIPSSR